MRVIYPLLHAFSLFFMSQSTIFQSCQNDVFLAKTSTKQWIKWFAQGHNIVTPLAVRLKSAALRPPD